MAEERLHKMDTWLTDSACSRCGSGPYARRPAGGAYTWRLHHGSPATRTASLSWPGPATASCAVYAGTRKRANSSTCSWRRRGHRSVGQTEVARR